jgi:DNA-binding XRE family transcriptional regulator
VRRARNRGLTWAAIAGALGVSKQAVHQKHGGGRRWRREP